MITQPIDTRFLSVHPDTAAWWRRRDKCEGCANLVKPETATGVKAMRCSASPREDKGVGAAAARRGNWQDLHYCIDARLPGMACGPRAALFTAKA